MVGHLCRHIGSEVFTDMETVVLSGIKSHLDRDTEASEQLEADMDMDMDMEEDRVCVS